ncbi:MULTISPECIES: extracellular solute-binding protein [unclassified Polaromonas]|jgi:iron(III) transport system substrate-binding protein|uniref:extracellular solute-binding protein n=1 Tax=unclassified Polaromonas TaxID=2638319 RepID=UPI000BD3FAB8|nr:MULTISPECIES: extracellular solute-binding protein [unclassified Polaromonas]OYY38982.1 MAG: Fe(3+) ABC transporter substrate-binding protein [Polaromonas sp. 35-63-35]OYZ21847.1 MAG: Fe(3+) ABC transporter substrate-binding protein [Polaromonas sp. 16-63-31]OYZ80286.1 MAG: Fe(3+) ABC transporter substrate-binding protein [Polaromonas sp. 24-63-21]OZA51348.1 MAG: Fe(3+) ABC transporter substrate-binding protein [Polaromonas sp. 17-63-33]OZA90181.1 MAG: Fe(3+) ABC transporter substrate-bindi
MLKKFPILATLAVAATLMGGAGGVSAQEQVVNLYSARHYQTDEALYSNFTKTTGIRINRVDADDAGILARLKAEGAASPADVILLVDAARLAKGDSEGLFQPIKSPLLEKAIPAQLRAQATPEGTTWFGFSTRARLIVYDKLKVKKADVDTYEELADPKNKGLLCTRSGSHPYNLSLFGAVTEHLGAARAEEWLKGMVANMARPPKGGDTDQIKGVASGECGIAITNSYYLARILRSSAPEDKAIADKVGVVFPNQQSWGTHVNIAGAAVAKNAKNIGNAVKFMEYLASPDAQNYFANGNNEWPAVAGVKVSNAALQAMSGGSFKSETIPISTVGANQVKVQQMLDRVGYK